MAKRIFNFNPGPATLPLEVLEIMQGELLDYRGTGMSVLEISHRSPEYDEINTGAETLIKELMGLGDDYRVLFMTGGASTQFAIIPMNFLAGGKTGAYVDTGTWSTKAIKEAELIGKMHLAASSKDQSYSRIPGLNEIDLPKDAAYLHITTNNTIKGTQWHEFPDTGNVPLIADMSSDVLSHRVDFSKFAMIYAGAQKNLGPAGVTVVVIRKDMIEKTDESLPTMFRYTTYAGKDSLYNTPPVVAVYALKLVLEWIKKQGGLAAVEKTNRAKQERIYQLMDLHPEFFRGTAEPRSRSWMNATMRLPSEDLEKQLISEAKAAGFGGLKGHRSVGGIRVSMYNAMTLEGVQKLADFMLEFQKKHASVASK